MRSRATAQLGDFIVWILGTHEWGEASYIRLEDIRKVGQQIFDNSHIPSDRGIINLTRIQLPTLDRLESHWSSPQLVSSIHPCEGSKEFRDTRTLVDNRKVVCSQTLRILYLRLRPILKQQRKDSHHFDVLGAVCSIV